MAAAYRSLPPTSARGPGLTKTQMQRSITDLQNLHGRSWVLTVPCTETLILGCIHLLVINSNRMTATRCGSSLSLSSPHQCPGPWPDENADAKKHHRRAKLSWSVGGAHGKWVTVSESEWEWAKPDWCQWGRVSQTRLMSTISTENITLRSQLVQTLERSSSVIHRSLSARAQGRKPCISNMLSRRQKRPPEGQKRPPEGQKFHPPMSLSLHPSEICMSLSLSPYLSIDLSIYLSNLPGRREHATCRSKMPAKTWQGHGWRKPCISNMPSRRQIRPPEGQKRPPEGQKFHPSMSLSLHPSEICMLSIYLSIYLSICQTCQADVNMQPAGDKCQLKHGRDTHGVSHVYQTYQADAKKGHLKAKNFIHLCLYLSIHRRYVCLSPYLPIYLSIDLSIYLSNLPGRREHATCRWKMPPKTWQGHEWRKPCISNMPSRRQKRPPEGQKFHPSMSLSLHPSEICSEICMSLSLSPYLSIYRSIYLSVKLARPTWTCNLQVKNAS